MGGMKALGRNGFTLIELTVTIVVVAILAGLSVVGYSTIQANARDAQIKSASQKIAEAIELWSLTSRNQPATGGSGMTGTYGTTSTACSHAGWLARQHNSCSFEAALIASDLLPADYLDSLPSNNGYGGEGHIYRLLPCSSLSNHFVLYYHLENPSQRDIDNYDNIVTDQCGNSRAERADYDMQGARLLDLTVI